MATIYNTKTAREEFALTGEDWLLRNIARADIKTVLDVGSNKGEWTRMARESLPDAMIHTFEIMPEVYRKFLDNGVMDNKIHPNNFGLGSKIGQINMKYCVANDTLNTHLGMLSPGSVTDMPFHWRECLTVTGDAYLKMHNIDRVDLLKIDVEGAEHLVLQGFEESFAAGKIGAIQFEYGTANIVARWLLVDANEFLTPRGFVFGKLRPGAVAFKPYDLNDENFFGPNIVAVHQSRKDILTALRG